MTESEIAEIYQLLALLTYKSTEFLPPYRIAIDKGAKARTTKELNLIFNRKTCF